MVLVVISIQFGETKKRETKLMEIENHKEQEQNPESEHKEQSGCWEGILLSMIQIVKGLLKKCCPSLRTIDKSNKSKSEMTCLKIVCFCCFDKISDTKCYKLMLKLRLMVKYLVDHEYFGRIILGAILLNSIFMGIEHHNQVKPYYIKIFNLKLI